jgi:hypothetical protein
MSDIRSVVKRTILLVALLPVLAGCLGTKHAKGRPSHSESGQFGATNWFGTSVTPETKKAETNAPPATAPDNTARNKRESDGDSLTPFDQGSGGTDLRITQNLRKAINFSRNQRFSFLARNIKIITVNNVVTLRGVVENESEKARIEAMAKQVPGVEKVINQLEIVRRHAKQNGWDANPTHSIVKRKIFEPA